MAKKLSSAELLLHPARLRIVQAFLDGRDMTTAQVLDHLSDISPATVYRHIARLSDGGILRVVAERPTRGSVERTWRLNTENASVAPQDARAMTKAQHRAAFMAFLATVLADFDAYLGGDPDFERDAAGYRMAAFHATGEEVLQFAHTLGESLAPLLANGPGPGRTLRTLTTVLLPTTDRAATPQDTGAPPGTVHSQTVSDGKTVRE